LEWPEARFQPLALPTHRRDRIATIAATTTTIIRRTRATSKDCVTLAMTMSITAITPGTESSKKTKTGEPTKPVTRQAMKAIIGTEMIETETIETADNNPHKLDGANGRMWQPFAPQSTARNTSTRLSHETGRFHQ
jgi:hypothetical protein